MEVAANKESKTAAARSASVRRPPDNETAAEYKTQNAIVNIDICNQNKGCGPFMRPRTKIERTGIPRRQDGWPRMAEEFGRLRAALNEHPEIHSRQLPFGLYGIRTLCL